MPNEYWPHQQAGLNRLEELVEDGERRILVTSPTGGGKSRMMTGFTADHPRAAIYTNRRMLFDQMGRNLATAGIYYGERAAGYPLQPLADCQLVMIQTERLAVIKHGNREVHDCDFIHVDEAHMNSSPGTQELFDRHSAVQIGWTATPLELGHVYDHLVVAGTNTQLRECGSHVPAHHFAPSEGGLSVIGRVEVGSGTCGIGKKWRPVYYHRIVGSVIQNYHRLNPEQRPTILFGPDVQGSIYLCEKFNEAGVKAAHIDGAECWLDGRLVKSTAEVREEIRSRSEGGDIKVVCNRFVLREGVDWPHLAHCIFATLFGSVSTYLQAGGRVVRSHPSLDRVTIADHGGNWWRYGSLNEDRNWTADDMHLTNTTWSQLRDDQNREGQCEKARTCPKCDAIWVRGLTCPYCKFTIDKVTIKRKVIEDDGTLRSMDIANWRKRKVLPPDQKLQREWLGRLYGARKYHPDRSFSQVYHKFAMDHDWCYPDRNWKGMPIRLIDFYLPVTAVPADRVH